MEYNLFHCEVWINKNIMGNLQSVSSPFLFLFFFIDDEVTFCKASFETATGFRGEVKCSFVMIVTSMFLGSKSGKTNDCS